MKAITLQQPWAWAIMEAGKDIENRTWRPKSVMGQHLLIHAGSKLDEQGMKRFPQLDPKDLRFGGLVGFVTVLGYVEWDGVAKDQLAQPVPQNWNLPGVRAPRSRAQFFAASPWWVGPIGWALEKPHRLPFHEMPGKQGLWTP